MKLLLLSKNFWPVSGENELLAGAFARQLAELDHEVTVLTWRMVRQWPEQFRLDGCEIIRVPLNSRPGWTPSTLGYYSRNRWHRHMSRWVASHAKQFDAAIVLESPEDGMLGTQTVGKTKLPTVSRIRREHVFPMSRQLARELPTLTRRATVFVTPDAELRQHPEFEDSPLDGYLSHVPDGWPELGPVKLVQEQQRRILARVHPILKVEPQALLAVSGADLTFDSGVFSLVRAWRQVLAAHPDARLWLLGSGANGTELFQRICDLDMQHSVLLPGTFDEIRDVLAAADAYIMPGPDDRLSWYSAMALRLGLTVLHHQDAPVNQAFAKDHRRLPFDDEARSLDFVLNRWASATNQITEEHEARLPSVEGKKVDDQRSVHMMVERYLELIHELRGSKVN